MNDEPVATGSPRAGPGRPRRIRGLEAEERRLERRRHLLDAALELYARQGYDATSIEQICQTAFVGYKGFYDEFRTKERLFLTLYDALSSDLGDVIDARVAGTGAATQASIHELMGAVVQTLVQDRRVAQVLLVVSAGVSPAVEARRRETHRRYAASMERAYRVGVLDVVDAPEIVAALRPEVLRRLCLGTVGALVEVIVDWLIDPDPDPVERLVEDLAQYCACFLVGVPLILEADARREH